MEEPLATIPGDAGTRLPRSSPRSIRRRRHVSEVGSVGSFDQAEHTPREAIAFARAGGTALPQPQLSELSSDPTTEAAPLSDQTTARRRPSTATTVHWVITIVTVLGLLVIAFTLIYKWTANWLIYPDEHDNEQTTIKPVEETNGLRQPGMCVLPANPEDGSYAIINAPNAKPGDEFVSAVLTVTCLPNFRVSGEEKVFCVEGYWSADFPKCIRYCKLLKHTSVRYKCLVKGAIRGTRKCNYIEPSGTEVKPSCKNSNYYSAAPLRIMKCIEGRWNYHAVCSPECGRVTPIGDALALGGRSAKHGELPWHVGIYRMPSYTQECGGSIVSNRLVISAAHCFWKHNMKQPAFLYAVAAGKIYRPWNNSSDTFAQKSFVNEIKIPARFRGDWLSNQNDIALLILKTRFKYTPYVSPVCLNFDSGFDNSQLQPGKMGKVSGWGLIAENGKPSQVLQVVELPYVDIDECINASPQGFTKYITSDKFCVGFLNGTAALCRGDSGGGLAFPESQRGTDRYYLRGIVSSAPINENPCNSHALTTFTHILTYKFFITEHLPLGSDYTDWETLD